jgi:hypothetical protein
MDTEERQRLMRGCIETTASLVFYTRVELGYFGEVEKVLSKVLSKLGDKERTNDPLTIISNPLFTVRWTCLSLVAIWILEDGRRKHASRTGWICTSPYRLWYNRHNGLDRHCSKNR